MIYRMGHDYELIHAISDHWRQQDGGLNHGMWYVKRRSRIAFLDAGGTWQPDKVWFASEAQAMRAIDQLGEPAYHPTLKDTRAMARSLDRTALVDLVTDLAQEVGYDIDGSLCNAETDPRCPKTVLRRARKAFSRFGLDHL